MIWHGSGTKRPERLTNGKSPGGRQGLSPGLLLGTRDNRLFRSATRYGKVPASRTSAPAISPSSPGHGLIAFATSPRSVRSVYSGVVQTALAWRSCSSSSFSQTEYVTLALPVTCTGMRQRRKPPTPSIRWKSEFPRPTSAARQAAPGSRPATTTGCQGQHHPEAHRSTSNQAHDRAHRDCTRSPPQRRTPAGTTTRPPRRAHGMAAEEGHMSSRLARPPRGMSEHLIERAFTRSLGARLACLRSCSTTQACRCPVRQPQREPGCTQRRRRPAGGNC